VLLSVPNLDLVSVAELTAAAALVETGRITDVPLARQLAIGVARSLVVDASGKIGSNLTFQIGNGTVMF
jgi:hypothetical protein